MRPAALVLVVLCGLSAALAACQSSYRPAVDPNQVGTIADDIGQRRVAGGILPACPLTGRSAESRARIRSAIESWYEVMRHLDHCDLSRLRYYTGRQYEAALRARAQQLAVEAQGTCARQAAAVDARLARSFATLRAWTGNNLAYCTLPDEMASLLDSSMPLEGMRAALDRQYAQTVANAFAGLGVAALQGP